MKWAAIIITTHFVLFGVFEKNVGKLTVCTRSGADGEARRAVVCTVETVRKIWKKMLRIFKIMPLCVAGSLAQTAHKRIASDPLVNLPNKGWTP